MIARFFTLATRKIRRILLEPKPEGVIYMLHRCHPLNRENLFWNEHLKVSPEFLKNFLSERIKTHRFISLDDLHEMATTGKRLDKPFIVMTFDDGYKDNFDYALPIFDEFKIPFTVYVTNCFPNRNAFLWWYALEDILLKNERIELADGAQFECPTKKDKERIFLELRDRILKMNQDRLEEDFRALFCRYQYDSRSVNDSLCLSWDEIRKMGSHPCCTIAAHTVNHRALNQLTDNQLHYEIEQSKAEIEAQTGRPVRHFSYPFGTPNEVGEREKVFVKQCGFDTVCYAIGGQVNRNSMVKTHELPRQFLGEIKQKQWDR